MPKIRIQDYQIKGKSVRFEMHYKAGRGFYFKGFDTSIYTLAMPNYMGYSDTEESLMDTHRQILRTYHELIKKEKTVIAYKIVLPTEFRMNKIGKGHWEGKQSWIGDLKIGDGGFDGSALDEKFGFFISYQVIHEIDDNGIKYFSIADNIYSAHRLHISKHDVNFIEHTMEREIYFQDLQNTVFELVKKIAQFLGNTEQLGLLIDNGSAMKLLS